MRCCVICGFEMGNALCSCTASRARNRLTTWRVLWSESNSWNAWTRRHSKKWTCRLWLSGVNSIWTTNAQCHVRKQRSSLPPTISCLRNPVRKRDRTASPSSKISSASSDKFRSPKHLNKPRRPKLLLSKRRENSDALWSENPFYLPLPHFHRPIPSNLPPPQIYSRFISFVHTSFLHLAHSIILFTLTLLGERSWSYLNKYPLFIPPYIWGTFYQSSLFSFSNSILTSLPAWR